MSQHVGGGGDSEPDFHISDEILSVIPTDPFEQLDLARKITSMAIASKVSNLEAEVVGLRQKLEDKERSMHEQEEKMLRLERDYREADSMLKIVRDENMKLTTERDSLATTVKKLTRDFAKLETFKRQLIKSLNDETESPAQSVDIGTCDPSVPGSNPVTDEKIDRHSSVNHSYSGSIDMTKPINGASRYGGQRFSMSQYMSPRFTPSATPKIISTSVSPRSSSAAVSPKTASGAVSPAGSHYEGKPTSFWYPSSQQSSAANSPPRGGRSFPARTPRMDGKEFFRQARSRLSYEQFSAFLANIKEQNAQKQTREETLKKAEEIFGSENKDLYLLFQGLLNRNAR